MKTPRLLVLLKSNSPWHQSRRAAQASAARCPANGRVKFALLTAATILGSSLCNRAEAAAFTFNGLGADGNFTTTLNWVGTAPANQNGNDFTYAVASGGQTNLTDNLTGNLYSQTFAAGCVPLTISESLQELQGPNNYFVQNLSSSLQTLTGTLSVFAGSSSFNSSNGPLSLGALTIRDDVANPVNIVLDGPFNGTVNGNFTAGSKTGGLIKQGTGTWELKGILPNLGTNVLSPTINAGTLILSGANTFSGNTRITAGTLVLNNASAMQNSTLDMNSADVGALQFGSTITAATLGGLLDSRNLVLTNNAGNPVTLSVGQNNANTTYSGVLTGGAGLTKVGTGILTLSTPVTLTGPVNINGGALAMSGLNTLQTASSVTVANTGSLQANVAGTYVNMPVTITGAGTTGNSQGALDFHSGGTTTQSWPGTVTLNGGATIGSYGVSMRTTLSSPVVGTGPLTIQAQGGLASSHTAAFTSGAAGAYSGNTTFKENGGLLWFAVTNGVANAVPPASALTLANVTGTCTYDLNGFNQTLAGLSGTGNNGSNRLVNSSATAVTLTISNTSATSYTYNGFLGFSGANNLSLIKAGPGIQNLNGANNNYSGGTIVTNGTLLATNLGSGNVSVATGAGLGAHPGNTVGTLSLGGNLTLNSSVVLVDLTNTANCDLIVVPGNLTPNGVTTISLGNSGPLPNGTYTLMQVNGTLGGTAANFSMINAYGQTYTVVYAPGSPNLVQLQVATTSVLAKSWQGDGSLNRWDIATGLDWVNSAGGSFTYVYNDGDFVTFNDTSTNPTVNLVATVSPSSLTVTNSVINYLIQGAGSLSGANGLTKQGTATLTLANTTANNYAGATTLSGGALQIGNNNAAGSLGTGNVSVTAAGTTLAFKRTDSITVTNAIVGTSSSLPNIQVGSGTVALGGTGDNSYATATVTNGKLVLAKSSSSTVHALGGGPTALTVNSGGTAQLGGAGGDQIYDSQNVQMNGGIFDLGGQNETVGQFAGDGAITNSGGAATLTLGGALNTIGALYPANGTLSLQSGTVTVGGTWNSAFGVAGGATFNQTGGTMNSGSYFAVGNGNGSGTAYMTASGGTFNSTAELLNGFQRPGSLTVSGTAQLSLYYLSWGDGTTNNVTMALNGGTILLNRFNDRGNSPGVVSFNGSLLRATTTQTTFMNAATNLTAIVSTNGALFDSQGNSITLTAPLLHDPSLGGSQDGGFIKTAGSGTIILTGSNTYTGPTIVSNGVLNMTTASLGGGSYAVADNATLIVTVAGPGQSLTNSSLRLGSAAGPTTNTFALGSANPTVPVTAVTGALNLTGPVYVNVTGTNLSSGTIVLLQYGSLTGAGSFVSNSVLPNLTDYGFILTNNTSAKQLQLLVTQFNPPLRWAVGSQTWDTSTANWQLLTGGGLVDYVETDPVVFDDDNTGTSPITVTLNTSHTPGSVTVVSTNDSYIFTGAPIAGTAGLAKNGPSTLTLDETNSFTGGTIISGGELTLAAASSSGAYALVSGITINTNGILQLGGTGGDQIAPSVTVTMAGGTFDMAGVAESAFTALNGYGTVEDSVGGGALTATANCTVSGGTMTLQSGGLTLNGPSPGPGLTINSGATFWQTGGTVNIPAYLYGNGQLTISGGNFGCGSEVMPGFQAAGVVTVNGGTLDTYVLRVGDAGNGTCFLYPGGTILTDQVYGDGSISLFYFNGGTLGISTRNAGRNPGFWIATLTHAYVSTNGAVLDTSNNGNRIYTILQALEHDPALGTNTDGGFTKQGVGTLTLVATNTFTGPTFINTGTLALSTNGSLAASSLIGINGASGAIFDVSKLNTTFTLASGQTLSNSAAATGVINGSLNTGAGIVGISYNVGTPALNLISGSMTISAATAFVIDNTGSQLADGFYNIITNTGTATVTGVVTGRVTVTDGGAADPASLQIISGGLWLVVGTQAPQITSQPVSLTRYVGGTAVFTAGVLASPAPQLQWQLNGANISSASNPSATNATLTLSNLQLSQAGTYVITATNSAGGLASDGTAVLTVLPTNAPPYIATILNNNPMGYWRFNDGESTTGYDTVGVNNVYDANAASPMGAGPRPSAFPGFESTNTAPFMQNGYDQGYASTVSLFNNLSNFTILGWFNIDPTQYPFPTDPYNNPQGRASLFGQRSACELGFYEGTNLYFFATGISGTIFANTNVTPGVWNYVAVVSDKTANTTTMYLNGQVVGTASACPGTVSSDLVSIGKNVAYPTSLESGFDTAFFYGSLDEVATFNHALSASAIQAIYNVATGTVSAVAPTNVVARLVNLNGTNNLVIAGSGGVGSYTVLTTTNLTTPLANWTTNATGQAFGAGGAVNFTNPVSAATPQLFYRIRVP